MQWVTEVKNQKIKRKSCIKYKKKEKKSFNS